jgi:hypothetical protein
VGIAIGAGAEIDRSCTNSCHECEEGNGFHFVLMLPVCSVIFMVQEKSDLGSPVTCCYFFFFFKKAVWKLRRVFLSVVKVQFI